jgi:hypothetical protein
MRESGRTSAILGTGPYVLLGDSLGLPGTPYQCVTQCNDLTPCAGDLHVLRGKWQQPVKSDRSSLSLMSDLIYVLHIEPWLGPVKHRSSLTMSPWKLQWSLVLWGLRGPVKHDKSFRDNLPYASDLPGLQQSAHSSHMTVTCRTQQVHLS